MEYQQDSDQALSVASRADTSVAIPHPRVREQPAEAEPGGSGRPALKAGAARALVSDAAKLHEQIARSLQVAGARRRSARVAFEAARDEIVGEQLATMPLARLKETTEGRLRLGAIENAGYATVGAASAAGEYELTLIDGVGPQTASRVIAAAGQIEQAMKRTVRVRFDPDLRPASQAALLARLYAYDVAEQAIGPIRTELSALESRIDEVLADSRQAASRLRMMFSSPERRRHARAALAVLDGLMTAERTTTLSARLDKAQLQLTVSEPSPDLLWQDYQEKPVAYNGLLIDVGELAPDVEAGQGYLPADIAGRVRNHPLDSVHLRVSLRGYQAFGAKFALAQGRTILGDEMGLGKTIEALAAMCHLHAEGATHFLVVCPASVLVNWTAEIRRHTELISWRLHGADRQRHLRAWIHRGGVAVTTYESLRALTIPVTIQLGMLIADEAHYVKNPAAERTKTVSAWSRRTSRVLFLTGTPMENRVEEFRSLVSHLRPEVAARVQAMDSLTGASSFRQAVAPVYLRRNQEDVLDELPPRIETEEWVELDGAALAAYRQAVASGNFMAMRQAAYLPGTTTGSAKLARLTELAAEATANGRKVVVFSYFLKVLEAVATVLGDMAVGPLTGSIPPVKRQALIDDFSARHGPAVLVSQIQAGGVGLNIQAASVVILTEPQWKPTIEDQAIARCHRMGQVRTVNVHRLLAEDSVDQRMLEILGTKAVLFDEYVRRSELKELTPDAVDVSDLKATEAAVSQAEAERRIVEIERKRLRLAEDAAAIRTGASTGGGNP